MSSPTSHLSKDLVELTPVIRGGENEQRKAAKVYDSELCMLALPPDEQQLLSRVSQYLFYQGIIPVVVRSPTEALIHSRHSRFAVIILPDNDPALIRKIRSVEGMNYGTPVIVISTADILPESTLQMLGTNEIHEAIHRTTNSEKLAADLISALNHVIGQQSFHNGNQCFPMLPSPVQTTWSTIPQNTPAPMPLAPYHHLVGPGLASYSATNSAPIDILRRTSPTQMQDVNAASTTDGSQIHGQLPNCATQQLQEGAVEQNPNMIVGEPLTEIVNQAPSSAVKVAPPLCTDAQENPESVLPGIETLLSAIQVVEGQEGETSANKQAASTFTKFTALNSPESDDARASSQNQSKRTRRLSAADRQKNARATTSDTELESLNDTKSPMSVSLAGKKPYFLDLDSYREAIADDPNATPVDRHNSKERHRRIRITKAAEFFKSVIPRMDPNMDKATAFHWTVYYMVFLRNALLKQDPPILPKLHQTFIEEWGEVFNLEDRTETDGK